MSSMAGLESCDFVRHHFTEAACVRDGPSIVIVAMTGNGHPAWCHRSMIY